MNMDAAVFKNCTDPGTLQPGVFHGFVVKANSSTMKNITHEQVLDDSSIDTIRRAVISTFAPSLLSLCIVMYFNCYIKCEI